MASIRIGNHSTLFPLLWRRRDPLVSVPRYRTLLSSPNYVGSHLSLMLQKPPNTYYEALVTLNVNYYLSLQVIPQRVVW